MGYITEREYNRRMRKVQRQNISKERKSALKAEKNKLKKKRTKPTTTKLIMAFIFINCTAVEIYAMVAMWCMHDLSALYTLITAVVTEAMAFAVYAVKAYNETKQEELTELEREKLEFEEEREFGRKFYKKDDDAEDDIDPDDFPDADDLFGGQG